MIPRTAGDAGSASRENSSSNSNSSNRLKKPGFVPKSSGYGSYERRSGAGAGGWGEGVGGGVGFGGAGFGAGDEREGGPESVGSDTASAASDINYMHESLRQHHPEDEEEGVSENHVTLVFFVPPPPPPSHVYYNVLLYVIHAYIFPTFPPSFFFLFSFF